MIERRGECSLGVVDIERRGECSLGVVDIERLFFTPM